MEHKLLIVDDEKNVRLFLSELFQTEPYSVKTAENGAMALKICDQWQPDVIILDLKLPDVSGAELITPLRSCQSNPEIIVITALGTVDNAVSTIRSGAYDFITKPFDMDCISLAVERCIEYRELSRQNSILKRWKKEHSYFQEFIGESPAVKDIKERAFRLVNTDVPILISGETGTGKNVLAQQIHHTLHAADSPVISVNCATLTEQLFESELFGHEKGAFTGAIERKTGRVEQAQGGTLILDEISEIPVNMQAKLLTFLQDKTFYPVGGQNLKKVNVRIIALTNRNLEEEVQRGTFRKDLYYRLNVIRFTIPPLRERRQDIGLLTEHFMNMFHSRYGDRTARLSQQQMLLLQRYSWPGNTRELKNILEQAYIYNDNGFLNLDMIQEDQNLDHHGDRSMDLKLQLENHEKQVIMKALTSNGGNRAATARDLGVSVRTLHYRLNYYDIRD